MTPVKPSIFENSFNAYAKVKSKITKAANLVYKDSFKLIRLGLSVVLLIVAFLFTLYVILDETEFDEKILSFICNKFEIINFYSARRVL